MNDVFDVLLQNDIFSDDIVERIKAETTRYSDSEIGLEIGLIYIPSSQSQYLLWNLLNSWIIA